MMKLMMIARTGLLSLIALALSLTPVWAESRRGPDAAKSDVVEEVLYGALVDLNWIGSNNQNLGWGNLMLPIVSEPRSLVFFDGRGSYDLDENWGLSGGIGARTMMDLWFLGDVVVGRYGYFDYKKTVNDSNLQGLTFGVELLSRGWETRINTYVPLGDASVLTPAYTLGNPQVLPGNQIVLDSMTAETEQGLLGVDGEIGVRIPLPSDLLDLRVYAGAFWFQAPTGLQDLAGPRGRAEVVWDFVPGWELAGGVEGRWDSVREEDIAGTVRLRIPLGGSKRASKADMTALERRMTRPVYRERQIVSLVNAPRPYQETTSFLINGRGYSGFTVLDNTAIGGAIGDFNATLSGLGNGALIVADGSAGSFNLMEPVLLQVNQALVGGGSVLTLNGDDTGGAYPVPMPGIRPTFDGPDAQHRFIMDDGTTVQGVDIVMGSVETTIYAALYAVDKKNLSIIDNQITITGSSLDHAIYVDHNSCSGCSNSDLIIVDNVFDVDAPSADVIFADYDGDVSVVDNVLLISGAETGIRISADGNVNITGNTVDGTGSGLSLYAVAASAGDYMQIRDNTILTEVSNGVFASIAPGSRGTLNIQNNLISVNNGLAVIKQGLIAESSIDGNIEIWDNWVMATGRAVTVTGGLDISVVNNIMDGGLDLDMTHAEPQTADVSGGNWISTVEDAMSAIAIVSAGQNDIEIFSNTIDSAGDAAYGVELVSDEELLEFAVDTNVITTQGTLSHGIYIEIPDTNTAIIDVGDNTFNIGDPGAEAVSIVNP